MLRAAAQEQSMQRAAVWEIPLAIAVAKSWADYLSLPGFSDCPDFDFSDDFLSGL